MTDVKDTLVFAVGISSYGLGDSWRLPNAAEHALEFACWAKRRRVPADRIHLFLSTADRQRLQPRIDAEGLIARPATFVVVTGFIQDELRKMTGDLLYMFWSGHGNMSEEGRRLLFYENASLESQLLFDLTGFAEALRSSSYKRIDRQLAFIDACANRFEELGFDASPGEVRGGKGRSSHQGVKQQFFVAANSGEQATAGAFGEAVLKALADASGKHPNDWPVDQDAIINSVRPQFDESGQNPVQLSYTTAQGDVVHEERVGDLPAWGFVNAAAYSRRIPVRAVRGLAKIALQYAQLGDDTPDGARQRDALYVDLFVATGRQPAPLRRSTPRVEMLHVVGTALQWKQEQQLHAGIEQLAAAGEFGRELQRIALVRTATEIVNGLSASMDDIRSEYRKTINRLAPEPARERAASIDAMLDELYQVSVAGEPRHVWEFLLRLAERFPADRKTIDEFIARNDVAKVTLTTLNKELNAERKFVLSFNVVPAGGRKPAIKELRALIVVDGTTNITHRFAAVTVTTWESLEEKADEIVQKAREIVMTTYQNRSENALLIEFLLPYPFLRAAAESLTLQFPRKRLPLGAEHPVVVRVRERTAEPHNAFGLDKWAGFGKRINRAGPGATHWVEQAGALLEIEACEGIVALRFFPDDDDKVLDIVDKGFPFIAWLRGEPTQDGWAEFVSSFTEWAKGRPLGELARNVRAIRESAPMCHVGLTLLWDDPEQIRPSFQLDDVSIGGN